MSLSLSHKQVSSERWRSFQGFTDAPTAQIGAHRNLNVNPHHPGPIRYAQAFKFETLHR
ncbi:unnamed protein product [Haemonchus placei]|uniref:Uncharacterized protein n=1 Tax=Haemonchus placei TaxID=6290 RepID=A0A0N4WI65_HAEPC|nr:unnamed protein product [Haemonchus placei]